MTLRGRLLVLILATVGLTAFGIAWLYHRSISSTALPEALQELKNEVDLAALQLESHVRTIGADVRGFCDQPTVRDLVEDGLSDAELRRRATLSAIARIEQWPHYLQVRILDQHGRECVRVDRSGAGLSVRVVAAAELQDKSDRPYFVDGMAASAESLTISPIELNQEHGIIQTPYVPVLRVSTPLVSKEGVKRGIAIINVDMRPVFSTMRTKSTRRPLFLVDSSGQFLIHPDSEREFESDRRVAASPPSELESAMMEPAPDSTRSRLVTTSDADFGLASTTLRPAGSPPLTLHVAATRDDLVAHVDTVLRAAIIAGIVVVVIAMLAASWLASSALKPVYATVEAVIRMKATGEWQAPSAKDPEMAVLANAIGDLIESIRQKSDSLEHEIEIRLEAEAMLEREAAELRELTLVAQSSSDAIYTGSLDGTISSWNPAAESIFGFTSNDVVGRCFDQLFPEKERRKCETMLEMLRRGEVVREEEALNIDHDGNALDVAFTFSPVKDEAGVVVGFTAIIRDVTIRRRLERLFHVAVDAAPNGLLLVDAEGTILLVNDQVREIFGFAGDELLGRNVDALLTPEQRDGHARLRESYVADPGRREMGRGRELYGLRKDGVAVPVEIGLNPVMTPRGLHVLASIVDITEIKKVRDELKRSNESLEQFAYVASHDLQEPLRMVANYTELLRERYKGKLDAKADSYIGYASDGARRMQRLVSDLLAYSRVGSRGAPLAEIDAQSETSIVIESLEPMIRSAAAAVECEPLPHLLADAVQFRQVLQNLIVNAIKFHRDEPPRVKISALRKGRFWQFTVEDNGIGIEEKNFAKVFELFNRTSVRDRNEGNGLGLAIVKRIVERHGGRIWIDSTVGVGTKFHFLLPAIESTATL